MSNSLISTLLILIITLTTIVPGQQISADDSKSISDRAVIIERVRQKWIGLFNKQIDDPTTPNELPPKAVKLPGEIFQLFIDWLEREDSPQMEELMAMIDEEIDGLSLHDQRVIVQRNLGLLDIYVLHHINDGENLVQLYRKLSRYYRGGLMRWTALGELAKLTDGRYKDLAEEHLRYTLQLTRDAESSREKGSTRTFCGIAVGFYARSFGPAGYGRLEEIAKKEIVDPSLRYMFVATVLSLYEEKAMPLAEWYFKTYAWEASEIKMVLNYFRQQRLMRTVMLSRMTGKMFYLKNSTEFLHRMISETESRKIYESDFEPNMN